jgi:hypothetical protein
VAQALTEDYDVIVEEFGRGCPCKNPPMKSTGKAHLKSLRKLADSQLSHKKVYQFLTCDHCEKVVQKSPCAKFHKKSYRKKVNFKLL